MHQQRADVAIVSKLGKAILPDPVSLLEIYLASDTWIEDVKLISSKH